MSVARYLPAFVALIFGIIIALFSALFAVNAVESRSHADVSRALDLNGYEWANVSVDGLQVILDGFAPDETARFRALKVAGSVIDASRLIDAMSVVDPRAIKPPRFSIEILRNDEGISLIGLIPTVTDREVVVRSIQDIAEGSTVTDLLETADFAEPDGWGTALSYGIAVLADLPRSKISIGPGRLELRAITDSVEEKRRLESNLARNAPAGLRLVVNISAPRPVISPYIMRFIIDQDGARFDACSTFTPAGRDKIISAARDVGLLGKATCTIGLGVPSPSWDDAVIIAIQKLKKIGGGSVTFSDADVTLVAVDTTPQSRFDQLVGELKSELPDAFSLHAILPEPVVIDGTGEGSGPPEFVATISPEGDVRLRGRIQDDRARAATESYAQAQFGSSVVTGALRIDPELPRGWSTRVLASLEALAQLSSGSIVTQPDVVEIRGLTGNPDAKAEISRILSEKLGASENYQIAVTYQEKLDEKAHLLSPQECVSQIGQVLDVQKIVFTPSSADIDDIARASIDHIAGIMQNCLEVPMEIGGHTDSQGREIMNEELSQARASSVLNALLARRVLTTNLTAVGYGESQPIADNKTEDGREANRRIEFKLIKPLAANQTTDGDATAATTDNAQSETEATDEQN